MGILSHIGRIFYGVAIAATGLLTIYYRDFPYYFIPPHHVLLNDHVAAIYLSGALLFVLAIISFGLDHYVYAHEATGYMPTWIGYQLFWIYFTGTCLLGSGIAILLKIRVRLFAALLGTMILIWVII